MLICPACGEENPPRFRLCGFCGTPLAPTPTAEVRKTVTILFSDVAGSTALGERLDPESLREVMGRYFAVMSAAIERHGGLVGHDLARVHPRAVRHRDAVVALEVGVQLVQAGAHVERGPHRPQGVVLDM